MSDIYTEQLVKQRMTLGTMVTKAALISVTLLSFFAIFLFPMAIIIPVAFIVADVFLFRRMNVEYEYLYINGELDVDKIMSKIKRKKIFSTSVNDIEIIAPSGSDQLNSYRSIKAVDYSSREPEHKTYEMIVMNRGQKIKVVFEPNQTILDGIRMLAPRKVFF